MANYVLDYSGAQVNTKLGITSKTAASGGTEESLVTTGEKYTWNNKANTTNPVFTGTITINGNINQLLTATQTRASYAGASGETPRYIPGKWNITTGRDPQNGDIYVLQTPAASTNGGIYLSVNGTANADYHPIILNTTAMMTTHFAAGTTLMVVYEANSTGSIYALEPTTNDKGSVTGIFRVINFYDTNTNTLLRTYASSSTNELPIIGSASSTSMGVPSHTSSYKDYYGGIPATVANRPVIKLSTGVLRSPAGFETGTSSSKLGNIVFHNNSNANKTTVKSGVPSSAVTLTLPTSTGTLAITASPAFTGTPTAPTAAAGTNTTQIATTAFVKAAIDAVGGLPSVTSSDNGKVMMVSNGAWTAATLPLFDGTVEEEAELISFTVQLYRSSTITTYYAEDGMTWGEWIASEYNTNGFFIDSGTSTVNGPDHNCVALVGDTPIYPNELIIANSAYYTNNFPV